MTTTKTSTGRVILKGEKAERTVKVDGSKVTIHHVSQSDDGSKTKVYMKSVIDFSDEDGDDILKWAAHNRLIGCLRKRPWKDMTAEQMIAEDGKEYKPCDWPAMKGGTTDPNKQASNAVAKMTQEEKLELMKKLQAEMGL